MLYIEIDRAHKRSYTKQIYRQIRENIITGVLRAKDRLPSTRELSTELCVARNTVLTAYDLLVAEGLLYSSPGAGFFVVPEVVCKKRLIESRATHTGSLSDIPIPNDCINFDSGLPALDLFPLHKWNHAMKRALNEAPISALGYDDPQGRLEFRQVISSYLKRTRGIECEPEQIIITTGTKQSLTLVAKSLLHDQSEVWIENPTNENVTQIFSYHTDKIYPYEVDEEGIQTHLFPHNRKPNLLFVTPSHQFPMGGILSIKRRHAIVEFARKNNCYILEDDYDSEFTYERYPANSLFELDMEHVIYAGTFSKIMFPSLRLGYLIIPHKLVPQIRKWKRLADHHSNSIYQIALMEFIQSGDMERHIRHMKKIYKLRRDNLISLLYLYFGERVKVYGFHAGMHIVAEFNGINFTPEVIKQLLNAGIYVVPVEKHSMVKGYHGNQIILGYAKLCDEEMKKGLDIVKEQLANLRL